MDCSALSIPWDGLLGNEHDGTLFGSKLSLDASNRSEDARHVGPQSHNTQRYQIWRDCKPATDVGRQCMCSLSGFGGGIAVAALAYHDSTAQQHHVCAGGDALADCCMSGPHSACIPGPTGSRTRTWISWARASPALGTWASPSTRSSTSRQAHPACACGGSALSDMQRSRCRRAAQSGVGDHVVGTSQTGSTGRRLCWTARWQGQWYSQRLLTRVCMRPLLTAIFLLPGHDAG